MGPDEVAGGDEGLLRRHKIVSALRALTLMAVGVWGVRLWHLRQEVARYRSYWSVPRGESGGIVYVALGDSTAQGIGASRPERGYVGLIAQQLRAITHRPVQVINLSVSGARVRDVVAGQLPKLAGMRADVITVAIGANDIRNYDADRFRTDVDALIAGLPPGAVVGDVPWFMHGRTGGNSVKAASYMADVARSHGLPVASLNRATRQRGSDLRKLAPGTALTSTDS